MKYPLSDEQNAIVNHSHGHAKVSAVAGSGKTTTMIARVKWLLEQGADSRRLLIVMFNVSAKRQFENRLTELLEDTPYDVPEVRTFHSLGLKITNSLEQTGDLPKLTLQTNEATIKIMAQAALNYAMRRQGVRKVDVNAKAITDEFISFIDLVKSDVLPPFDKFQQMGFPNKQGFFVQAYNLYENRRGEFKSRTFSDVIRDPVMAIRGNESLYQRYTDKFDHIIIDEYQDINEIQQLMIRQLAGNRAQVMAVGDVDQCIYAWRGAQPKYMLSKFENDFGETTVYPLTRTYRFGHQLSLIANHSISHNKLRDDKICVSAESNPNTEIEILESRTGMLGSAQQLVKEAEAWQEEGRKLSEICVLVRLYAFSVDVQLELLKAGIPFRMDSGQSVFQMADIKGMLGVLEYVDGSLYKKDPEYIKETLESILGSPPTGLKKEQVAEVVEFLLTDPSKPGEAFKKHINKLTPKWQSSSFYKQADLWDGLKKLKKKQMTPSEIITWYRENSEFDKKVMGMETTQQSSANRIIALDSLLAYLDTIDDNESVIDHFSQLLAAVESSKANSDSILITSCHKAKGLEFPLVMIPGLYEGGFPYIAQQEGDVNRDIEEEDERRLFYVAITRAIERLVLLVPRSVDLNKEFRTGRKYSGKYNASKSDPTIPSRFVFETNADRVYDVVEQINDNNELSCVSVEYSDIFDRYANELELTTRVTRTETEESAKAKTPSSSVKPSTDPNSIEEGDSVLGRRGERGVVEKISGSTAKVSLSGGGSTTFMISDLKKVGC